MRCIQLITSSLPSVAVCLSTTLALGACATAGSTSSKDAAVSSSASPSTSGVKKYPLDTCIVTDNALGSMGDPIVIVYDGQEVAFCCKPCVKLFEANPQQFLAKLPPAASK
ncbi:MAG: hypothetical protein EXS10_07090 [Phycisphaerales bacterium]|nr:hypothetical protein [Phycisphaerales bacterium]